MHPILFHVGPLPVRSYGVLILIGFFVALRYVVAAARRRSAREDLDDAAPGRGSRVITSDHVLDMALVGLVVGIIGTRIVFVALHWSMFRASPLDGLKIWTGGLSFIGGPIFGFAYAWWYCRRHGLPFTAVADLASPGFALAYAFGRVGCFFNGCCYGHPCSLPWAVRFQADGTAGAWTQPSHPSQLYAAGMSLLIFAALHALLKRRHRDGSVVVAYFALYAVYRFANDSFRAGATSRVIVAGLTDGQLVAAIAVPVLLVVLVLLNRRRASRAT